MKLTPAKPVPLNVAPKVVGSAGGACSGLSLKLVPGVKPPKVTGTVSHARASHAKVIICGSRGKTSGSPVLTPVHGGHAVELIPVHGSHAVQLVPAKPVALKAAPTVVGSAG